MTLIRHSQPLSLGRTAEAAGVMGPSFLPPSWELVLDWPNLNLHLQEPREWVEVNGQVDEFLLILCLWPRKIGSNDLEPNLFVLQCFGSRNEWWLIGDIGSDIHKRMWRRGAGLIVAVFRSSLYSWRNQGSETQSLYFKGPVLFRWDTTPPTHTHIQGFKEVGQDWELSKPASRDIVPSASLALPIPPPNNVTLRGPGIQMPKSVEDIFLFKSPWVPSCHTPSPELRSPELWANSISYKLA